MTSKELIAIAENEDALRLLHRMNDAIRNSECKVVCKMSVREVRAAQKAIRDMAKEIRGILG